MLIFGQEQEELLFTGIILNPFVVHGYITFCSSVTVPIAFFIMQGNLILRFCS